MKEFDLENNQKIESGFNIPDQYFESLEFKIMDQLTKNPVKVINLFKTRKFWIGSVAAILLIAITAIFYFNNSEISNTNTEEYLTYQTNLSTEDIVEHLTDDDILKIEASLNLYDTETVQYAKKYLQ